MIASNVAIIGTAGRRSDADKLTNEHFEFMISRIPKILTHLDIDMGTSNFISGGAAWADHTPVEMVLRGMFPANQLTLYLPTDIDSTGTYYGNNEKSNKTASTCNYYHNKFSDKVNRNTLSELIKIREMGATLLPGTGNFFARNIDVAKSVSPDGVVIAFTFGNGENPAWSVRIVGSDISSDKAGLNDGGTAHTFNACKAKHKVHVTLA